MFLLVERIAYCLKRVTLPLCLKLLILAICSTICEDSWDCWDIHLRTFEFFQVDFRLVLITLKNEQTPLIFQQKYSIQKTDSV